MSGRGPVQCLFMAAAKRVSTLGGVLLHLYARLKMWCLYVAVVFGKP